MRDTVEAQEQGGGGGNGIERENVKWRVMI